MKVNFYLLGVCTLFSSLVLAQKSIQTELKAFTAQTGATFTIDKATNMVSFISFPNSQAFKQSDATIEEKALSFVNQNGNLFGIQTGRDEFKVQASQRDTYGMGHVVLQKYANGVPVYDGILKFHFNKNNDLSSLNGNSISTGKVNLTPSISSDVAAAVAIRSVEREKSRNEDGSINFNALPALKARKVELMIFQKGLAQGYQGAIHLVYQVEVGNDSGVREFLFIDAHSKQIVEQFTGTHGVGLHRVLYEPSYSSGDPGTNRVWEEGDTFPGTLSVWQQSEIETAGHIYHFMKNSFGHLSYDNGDAPMITTHNNPSIACPNANWNGITANYCDKVSADDVVAHEWGHAYTEYTSGLIYAWQSGALNESYSDIWGETVDLLNGYFDSGEGTALRNVNGTDNPAVALTTRWRIGEQATAFGGAIRDMYNPNAKGNPGRVGDNQYYCAYGTLNSNNDQGGVHINSGIFNHSYALLVDGGNYNGQTITGIGLIKAAHIYWYAQANFMTQTTDFAAQADILEASATALMNGNVNLKNLSTLDAAPTLSNQFITAADIAELKKVLLAVELRSENSCGYSEIFAAVDEICVGGQPENAIFYENFESGLGSWTVENTSTSASWVPHNWTLLESAPGNRTGNVAYTSAIDDGDCYTSVQNGLLSLTSPVVNIAANASGALMLAFDHYISTEEGWDGGVLMYRINGGLWTQVASSAFVVNGYNNTLISSLGGNNNPLQGLSAFSGTDEGTFSGSWGQSRVDLSALGVVVGNTVQLRWDYGSDGCTGYQGWFIDDVRIYSCAEPTVQFVTGSTILNEAEGTTVGVSPQQCLPYVEKIVTIRINKAPTSPVTVTMKEPTGTAAEGASLDYTFSPNSFVLQSGALSQDIIVRIYNDAIVEGTETAVLSYSLSTTGDAIPESILQEHTLTIHDNEVNPGIDPIVVLYADFNDDKIPDGWIADDNNNNGKRGEFPEDWAIYKAGNSSITKLLDPTPAGRSLIMANSDEYGQSANVWTLETAPFNTVNMKSINLTFLQAFRVYSGAGDLFNESGEVQVWDGKNWRLLLVQMQSGGNSGAMGSPVQKNITIPDSYANAEMKLRFIYAANYDMYWAIDNIKVTALPSNQIETAVSTAPDEQYLGPNATVYYNDPVTKNLMVRIKNLTTHDYGCTKVEIDRSGVDATAWFNNYKITKKTFKVTPTNNNANGQYEITLYYKASELPTFNGSAITSMGKSEGGIGAGNAGSNSFAEVYVESVLASDYAFTATFDSGFSGFGLSDAPPVGSLPVKLVKFEGKNTGEGNLLKWTTTSEVNSDYFAVERGVDGKNFKEIGKVLGKGNSSLTNDYSFNDRRYLGGVNYYRLKQVDQDGSFAYSSIVSIDGGNSIASRLYPNPVQSVLTIEIPDEAIQDATVKIVAASGVVISEKAHVKLQQGLLVYDISKLSPGVYQIIVTGEDGVDYNFSVVKI